MPVKGWLPHIFHPDYTWPRPPSSKISTTIPQQPKPSHILIRRAWGFLHRILSRFSEWYCARFDIPFNAQIIELPFGLILKWTDRTRIEEVVAMQVARSAGMPVPKVLNCGEHPGLPTRRVSILMTRLPGFPLANSYDALQEEEVEGPWMGELGRCLDAMRTWPSPHGEGSICSIQGTSIRSSRVPGHLMGPCKSEKELHDYLLSPASSHGFGSGEEYQNTLAVAKKIQTMPHRIVFTHGDFKHHNILVDDDGHLSGFLDWECAGWCPEYWEYTTAMRFGSGSWWYQVAAKLGGDRYLAELECDRALNQLTVDSYIAF